jgi:hypothetical protein
MSNFVKALENKINELRSIRDGLLEDAANFDTKIQLLEELLWDETGEEPAEGTPPKKRRPGRPKGSKNKKKASKAERVLADPIAEEMNQELYKEAVGQLGEDVTTPEQQEKLTKRFNPMPRPTRKLGTGVRVGNKAEVVDKHINESDARVGGEEEDEE